MKYFYSLILIFLFTISAKAQAWLNPPYLTIKNKADSSKLLNFYAIQQAFNNYEKDHDALQAKPDNEEGEEAAEGKFPGYAQYKRWEYYMEPRVYPSGDITLPSTTAQRFNNYLHSSWYRANAPVSISPANWLPLGPTGTVTNGYFGGAARVNFIRFDPTNSNIMWASSPLGGLWKSTDGGVSWATGNTDQLPIIGCSDIAIDPLNTQKMYLATGDANGYGSQLGIASIGILKSTNGGATWGNNTLNWTVNSGRIIYKLLINPIHPDTVFAATSIGIYRTVNGGTNWISMQGGGIFTDIEYRPGNPNILYAVSGVQSSGTFYKSIDGGATFSIISSGLPTPSNVARLEIAVTPADTNYVYVVSVKKVTHDLYGFYRSTDGGDNFTLQASTPNILSGVPLSQGTYNLCMAASPLHRDTVLVGGTNIYKTVDGGVNWVKISSESVGVIPFMHPDQHSVDFLPGTDSVYICGNDGGVWKSTDRGVTWNPFNEGLQIAQMYRLGTSPFDPYTILTGHQDMATQTLHAGIWSMFTPNTGDGMECIYGYTQDSIRYLESYNGRVIKTYNTYPLYNIVCTTTGSGINAAASWITPIVMNPSNENTLLIGKAQVWRTVDAGATFAQVGDVTGGSTNLVALAYAPSDSNFIYAAKTNRLFVSTNGSTFSDRTGTLPVSSLQITSIVVCNTNPAKVWVTFSGYSSPNKVWYSSDAGLTWSNYSTGLPNLPVNCITYQNASYDGLYAGTDVGVYYIDKFLASWQPYFTGLPNVGVEELEIAYGIGKIRAATNGRALWESDLAVPVPALITWVGGISTDWNNPLNWSPNAVPTSRQDVIIPQVPASNFYPVVNITGLGCRNLTVNTNATITFPPVFTFKLKGS